MPADEFGSVAADAFALGTLVDTLSLDGVIATKSDADWFRFTASQSGKVTMSVDVTRELVARRDVAGTVAGLAIDAGQLSFDVVAGQTYAVGLATAQPATVARIAEWAKKVEGRGFVLVPVTMVAIKAKSS